MECATAGIVAALLLAAGTAQAQEVRTAHLAGEVDGVRYQSNGDRYGASFRSSSREFDDRFATRFEHFDGAFRMPVDPTRRNASVLDASVPMRQASTRAAGKPATPLPASAFTGTFVRDDGKAIFRLKSVGGGFHGVIEATVGAFAVDAYPDATGIAGTVHNRDASLGWRATATRDGLILRDHGTSVDVLFLRYSTEHGLGSMDLRPYLGRSAPPLPASARTRPGGPAPDSEYDYSQSTPGQSSESHRTSPGAAAPTRGAVGHSDPRVAEAIVGNRLVYYTRTSILNDSTASSISFLSFCPDGRFYLSYDGSYAVEGDTGGNAQGASGGNRSGVWQVVNETNGTAVRLLYANGEVGRIRTDLGDLQARRWRVGNTQYAIERGRATCY